MAATRRPSMSAPGRMGALLSSDGSDSASGVMRLIAMSHATTLAWQLQACVACHFFKLRWCCIRPMRLKGAGCMQMIRSSGCPPASPLQSRSPGATTR